jgi:hypothetical protein
MKEFNLNDVLAGAPVVTRDGRPVKIAGKITTGINEAIFYMDKQVLGLIGRVTSQGTIYSAVAHWDENGRTYVEQDTENDLFMAPTTRKEWIVRGANGNVVFGPYKVKAHAESCYLLDQGATIHEIIIME